MVSNSAIFAVSVSYPWMFVWLPAAAIPFLINIWKRRPHREIPWAAMKFLQEAEEESIRQRSLRNFVLMLVRSLAIVLFVIALTDPYLETAKVPNRRQGLHHIIVIDVSFSMTAQNNGQTVLDRAKQLAHELIHYSNDADTFTIIAFGKSSHYLLRGPVADRGELQNAIARATPQDFSASLTNLLSLLTDVLKQSEVDDSSLITIFSDLQDVTWSSLRDPVVENVWKDLSRRSTIRIFDAGLQSVRNIAISDLQLPYNTQAGSECRVNAVIQNYSDHQESVSIAFHFDGGTRREVSISVEPRATRNVFVTHRFEVAGDHRILVQVDDDSVSLDNQRFGLLRVHERFTTLCVEGYDGASRYVVAALGSFSDNAHVLVCHESDFRTTDIAGMDCIVFCDVADVTRAERFKLEKHIYRGNGIIFCLGQRANRENLNDRLNGIWPCKITGFSKRNDFRIKCEAEHPLVVQLAMDAQDLANQIPVFRYCLLQANDRSRSILTIGNGDPLVVETTNLLGRVAVMATPAFVPDHSAAEGSVWNAMPLSPAFPPLMRELVLRSCDRKQELQNMEIGGQFNGYVESLEVGEFLDIKRDGARVDSVTVNDDGRWRSSPIVEAGVYDVVNSSGMMVDTFATNVDTIESNLDRFDISQIPSPAESITELVETSNGTQSAPRRNSLLHHILLSTFVVLIAEAIIANRWR